MEEEVKKQDKPIKAKPVFYACCFEPLKAIAKDMGYNLLINGSLNRDMDLVAIPWSNDPKSHVEVLQAFDMHLRGIHVVGDDPYHHSKLPGGRDAYVINLNRGGRWNQYQDEQWYVDISFTPFVK